MRRAGKPRTVDRSTSRGLVVGWSAGCPSRSRLSSQGPGTGLEGNQVRDRGCKRPGCSGAAGTEAQVGEWVRATGEESTRIAFPARVLGFQLTWACTRPGTIASILGTLPWGGGQQGLW